MTPHQDITSVLKRIKEFEHNPHLISGVFLFYNIFIIKEYIMKKIIRLTEKDLTRIVKRVIEEQKTLKESDINLMFGLGTAIDILINGTDNSSDKVKNTILQCQKSKSPITSRTNQLADRIYDSIAGLGTDEQMVFRTLKQLKTLEEFCGVSKSYRNSYGKDLFSALDGDFDSESEWVQIMRPIRDLAVITKQKPVQKPQGGAGTRPSTGGAGKPQGGAGTRPSTGGAGTRPSMR